MLSFGVSDIQCRGTRDRQRHRQVQGINRVDSLQDLRQRSDFQKSEETVLCQIANLLRIAIYDHP